MIVLLDLTKVLKTIAFTNVYHKINRVIYSPEICVLLLINNNSKKGKKFSLKYGKSVYI
ncbi:hypothetical protein YN1551_2632 [Sulfolobus islandicus Y.N.15.51]|jgi:hypothetical protein|uniref:Uncharacterized protein n=1 Tax=Saccharolobus islandicus (strain Y.N.15.51 / Yellowstone \|nr:hypothetical protein YN1551_2632 [Sulfolobus islandicus Y.N.15.51]